MKRVYVGMGLTHAPKFFREGFQRKLKSALVKELGIEVLEFVGLEQGEVEDVYVYDRNCAERADLCLFIADYPSIGLGMEIVFRLFTKKPMLVLAHSKSRVTRMLTGMCVVEKIPIYRYNTVDEIVEEVQSMLNALK